MQFVLEIWKLVAERETLTKLWTFHGPVWGQGLLGGMTMIFYNRLKVEIKTAGGGLKYFDLIIPKRILNSFF